MVAMPEASDTENQGITAVDEATPSQGMLLTVIVPARNEEDCLGACLESLVSQSEEIFALGKDWELLVVDDASTDRTREIAESFAAVTVLRPAKLEKGWTGKANACWTAAQQARGHWLLFTDADTVHEPGNLRRAIHEAEKYKAGVLSYSPRQLVSGVLQRALMPLVFSELALAYPPEKVSNPELRIAAANGQFLLASREAYKALGGHASVKGEILEDVELAFLAKRRKLGLRFRYAARNLWRFYARVAKSNFPAVDCALSPLALPLFIVLLYRSWFQNRVLHRVAWKGRSYPT
jgi:glycosyltransferase involved in cell wall biosynthesis